MTCEVLYWKCNQSQPLGLFSASVDSKKVVLGEAGPLVSVWRWGLGSLSGPSVRGKS